MGSTEEVVMQRDLLMDQLEMSFLMRKRREEYIMELEHEIKKLKKKNKKMKKRIRKLQKRHTDV
jgi:prefoldin subunit 5|tara:strand:+ start:523 stop:714 length:192 start_codon:yes stop_codon:yes gene_type:complete